VALRLWLFVMRLSCSGRGFAAAFAHQAQEAFFEGHVRAFAHFGGVPAGRVRYDSLKPAVTRALLGRDRVGNERSVALRSHYGPGSFFCEPGVEGAHEKGAVDGEESRRGESHPPPLAEPCVNLSAYTAPIVQPPGFKPMRQWANSCGDRREASASSSRARFSRRRSRLYLRMAQRTR